MATFPIPPTWLDKFFLKSVELVNALLPDEPILRFLGNVTVVDNAANGSTDVTIGTSNAVEALVVLTGAISAGSLVPGTRYLCDMTAGAFTQSLPTTGLQDGQWFEFTDAKGLWATAGSKNLTLNGGTIQIEDPNYIGISWTTATTVVLKTVGETFRATYSQAEGLWYVR